MAVYFLLRKLPPPQACCNAAGRVLACEHAKPPCCRCGFQPQGLSNRRRVPFFRSFCPLFAPGGWPKTPSAASMRLPLLAVQENEIGQRTDLAQGDSRPVLRGCPQGTGRHRPAARARAGEAGRGHFGLRTGGAAEAPLRTETRRG